MKLLRMLILVLIETVLMTIAVRAEESKFECPSSHSFGDGVPDSETITLCEPISILAEKPVSCCCTVGRVWGIYEHEPFVDLDAVPDSIFIPLSSSNVVCGCTGQYLTESHTITNIVIKMCGQCPPGTDNTKVNSMRMQISLGRTSYGEYAGHLEIYSRSFPDLSYATPAALQVKTAHLRDMDVIRDTASGEVRQIMATECFVTVEPLDSHRYTVSFYSPGSVAPNLDVNGCYVLNSGSSPFSHYLFENPDTTNAFERLRITKTFNGSTEQSEFSWRWDAQNRPNWALSKGGGLQTIGLCVEPYDGGTFKTLTTRAQDGKVAAVERKQYVAFGSSQLPVQIVRDPDGAALTTRYEYYADGKRRITVNPDGSWDKTLYSGGLVSERRSGWLDVGTNATAEATQVTSYDHTPFLTTTESNAVITVSTNVFTVLTTNEVDVVTTNEYSVVETNTSYDVQTNLWPDTGATDPGTPRVETVIAASVPVAKPLRVIYTDTMGYKTVEEVRLLVPRPANRLL